EQRPDSHLLNGPALHDKGVKQHTVEDILNESAGQKEDTSLDDIMSFDAIDDFDAPISAETTDETADLDDISFDTINTDEDEAPTGAIEEKFSADAAMDTSLNPDIEQSLNVDISDDLDFEFTDADPSSPSD
ncbi:unnamed protein product, partial [Scytosiphon promiscuus]